MLRLSWTQPEDLVPHALVAAELDGVDIAEMRSRWVAAGGSADAAVGGATAVPADDRVRALARTLLDEIDALTRPAELEEREPDGIEQILAAAPTRERPRGTSDDGFADRLLGAWLGRAAGCLLGKPVEKIPRAGIRAIAQSTGNWPIRSYFTERGLDAAIAARYPWNRRSRPTSLVENIDGMPEDDDLNFPLIALELLEQHGADLDVDAVATSWLANLPGGRVFTAERIVYRNLLDGHEPDVAATVRNPFTDWIGAAIRTDVYGWVSPGDPERAARLAWHDGILSHRRNGLYGALFVAGASAAAVVGASVGASIDAGLSVIPGSSRYADAVRFGVDAARAAGSDDDGLDALHERYGHLHWVHALNNAALLAYALTRGGGDFVRSIAIAVSGGWDTDSVGATTGALVGAFTGAHGLPAEWTEPLHNRLASSVPGFDGARFDELAARTLALAGAFDPERRSAS